MSYQLSDIGEEYIIDVVFGGATAVSSIEIGVYDESTDGLGDADDLAAITTEPGGASYARQTASIPGDMTIADSGGDWQVTVGDQSFDTSDSTQTVDSFFVVVNFTSDDAGDGSDTDHLFFNEALDQTYDLQYVDTLTASGQGVSIT